MFKLSSNITFDFSDMLYNNIEEIKAGKYRDCNVLITGSEYELPKYNEIPQLMKNFCAEIYSCPKENLYFIYPDEPKIYLAGYALPFLGEYFTD